MKQLIKTSVLSAAVAAVPMLAFTSAASAQYRVDNSHITDANNRVGSGGTNPNDSAARGGSTTYTPNDIVYGNVTGGKEFRGSTELDPRAFRGNIADRNLDNFIRSSSGSGPDARMSDTATPFYGAGRGVPPPPGFVPASPTGGTQGGYIPNPAIENRPLSDQRLGDVNFGQSNFALPAPGQFYLPGPVDASAGQQYMITASPLTGIQQVNVANPGFMPTITNTQYQPVTGQLTPQQIEAMQNELNAAAGTADQTGANASNVPPPPLTNTPGVGTNPGSGTEGNATGLTPAGLAGQSGNSTANIGAVPIVQQPVQGRGRSASATPVTQRPINTAVTPLANNVNTNQSTRNRIVNIPPPQQQSALYARLLKNYDQLSQNPAASDVQAQQAFNALQRAGQQAKAQPGALPGQPGAVPGLPGQPGVTGAPGGLVGAPGGALRPDGSTANQPPKAAPGVTDYAAKNAAILKGQQGAEHMGGKPEPVKVPSLAIGVKGRGLEQILTNAEALMKDGKFTSALQQYDDAEQVAPNNPLINLGRANAELGASYYARADAHLRAALSNHPELLRGQYDLIGMLGQDRLQTIVKDLKELAKNDEKEPRPVFLLAYIYYNIGDTARAQGYVDLADKRAGGKDPFYKLLRDNWNLPPQAPGSATTQGSDLNK